MDLLHGARLDVLQHAEGDGVNIPSSIRAQFVGIGGLMGLVIVVLVVGYMLKSCNSPKDNTPKLPPAVVRTIDSLDRTKPEFDRSQDSLRHALERDTIRANAYKVAADAFSGRIRAARRLADSLAGQARTTNAPDSGWRRAYEERTVEAEGLRSSLAQTDSAYRSERDARITLGAAYGADTLRRIAVEKLNAGLRKAIDDLERPCKFARFISCPSRTTTAVVSAIVGAGSMYVVRGK